MKKKNKKTDNELSDQIYEKSSLSVFKISLILLSLILLGFILNFPLSSIIESHLSSTLRSLPGCPLSFDSLKVSFLPPRLEIKKPSISQSCFPSASKDLNFSDIKISFNGPALYPPGIKLSTVLVSERSKIELYPSLSLFKQSFRIANSNIDSELLSQLMGGKKMIQGDFALESLLTVSSGKLSSMQTLIKSKNVLIPPSDFSGVKVPRLDLGSFSLKLSYNSSKADSIIVNSLVLGNELSPVNASAEGKILINKMNFNYSNLDINSDVKFSKLFLDSFPIINMLLSGKKAKEGFYNVKISGPLEAPQTQVL